MKKARSGSTWFFVDESGDPTFYDRNGNLIVGQPGCSPILILGFIETRDPESIRNKVHNLQDQIIQDPYLETIPSIQKTAVAFHAKDDAPEVRMLFFKLIASLEFRAQFIVARKIERVFRNRFDSRETLFYDHLVTHLFKNVLHHREHNHVYFAKRGSRTRQAPLVDAIRSGVEQFERKWETKLRTTLDVQAQTPKGEPCLSVVDYMNWAIYQVFTKGQMRYFNVVKSKASLIVDLYDTKNYPNNWYNHDNPFNIEKITPL